MEKDPSPLPCMDIVDEFDLNYRFLSFSLLIF